MSSTIKATLALIGAALFVMVGSFVWFVATWDKDAEEPVVLNRAAEERVA